MIKTNLPIVLIEDDPDDNDIMSMVFKDLGVNNKVYCFTNTMDAYTYLETTFEQPFIIFCDVNLPGENGIEFKTRLNSNPYLREKSVPFIFYSTSADKKTVKKVFKELTPQGFFEKKMDYQTVKETIDCILHYWFTCVHPNS